MLDDIRYPWTEDWAQQLHATLTQLYPSRQRLAAVAQRAGIEMTEINSEQAIAYVWSEVLDLAAPHGLLEAVVRTARDLLPETSPRRPFLTGLLAGAAPETDGAPRGPDGAPRFISGTDEVYEREALLYHDDLTIGIGEVPALIAALTHVVRWAPSVCKLTVRLPGARRAGTGFRIGPDLLLTNWHVLDRATAVTADFDYEDGSVAATTVGTDPGSIVGDREDDWAVIRTSEPLPGRWPIVRLDAAAAPVPGERAFIVQHPDGQRKRLGFVRNQISDVDERVVHYLTDTEAGSSGAPVFDAAGRLIALHHAGGRPQEVFGRPPTVKNEGIRIERVVAGLAESKIWQSGGP
ncbi:trypsin-like peptidase domain-containing protein [Actinoplanes sp. CA-030573]|uniref:trypsin-like peptidase domain-containing protein n=1 Tax=Actinoplanes sp. CA-030573 TaxID=3239898 RepID=UPI003D915A79